MKTCIKGHFFTLRNVVSASFLGILAALERHFNQGFILNVFKERRSFRIPFSNFESTRACQS